MIWCHPGSCSSCTLVRVIQNTGGVLPPMTKGLDFPQGFKLLLISLDVFSHPMVQPGFCPKRSMAKIFKSLPQNMVVSCDLSWKIRWWFVSNWACQTYKWAVVSKFSDWPLRATIFFFRNSKYFTIHLKFEILGLHVFRINWPRCCLELLRKAAEKNCCLEKKLHHAMMWSAGMRSGSCWLSMYWWFLTQLLRKKCCTPKGTDAALSWFPISFALGSGSTDNQPTQYHHTTTTNLRSCENARVRPDSIVFGPIRSTRAVQLCKLWQTSY